MANVDNQWQEVKSFMDAVRDSGVVNPLMAGVALEAEFGFNRRERQYAVMKWVKSFD